MVLDDFDIPGDPQGEEPRPTIAHTQQADDLSSIVYRGKLFAEMMATKGWQLLERDLLDRKEQLLRSLVAETLPDRVGEIATLQASVNAIDYVLGSVSGVVCAMRAAQDHRPKETG